MVDLALLEFMFDGKPRKSRRVTLGDYSAVRERIRRDRLTALGMRASAEMLGIAVGQPVLRQEMTDFMFSEEGQAFLLFRCVHDVDQTFTEEEAWQMVVQDDPFVHRLLEESKIISPPTPPPSQPGSSGEGDSLKK